MDWLRRNWPDLLIGVALIAVIAGIIATLISGGSFFPVRDRTAETPRATTPLTSSQAPGQSASQPQTPSSPSAQSDQPVSPAAVDEPPAVAVGQGGQEGAGQAGAGPAGGEGQAQGQAGAEPVAPPEGAGGGSPPPTQALPPDAGANAGASPQSSVVSSPNRSAPAQQPPAAQSGGGPLPSASASDEAPYRVSVGAFANADNAQRQLERFQAAGYPAFIGTQGDLRIVLVGPYDTEQEARSVAARIAGSDLGVPDPTVYRLQADEEAARQPAQSAAQPAAQSAAPSAAQPAAQSAAPAAQPAASGAAPSAASRYLQVGAYGSRDSSLPQRERLEAMGFVVTDRVENGLVKLLVGPFDATELASAQARLQSAGIESFPR